MAAASAPVVNGGTAVEPPKENKAVAAASAAPVPAAVPCPWSAAVAERYERREKLGQGMFGDVYRAWDRVDGRFVAVKRLAGRTGGGFVQAGIRDFAREAMSLAACRGHPSVVELLATYADSARGDGDCFLVTGYAGPMNLRQYMALRRREGPPLDEDVVRDAMRQLLAGVRRAHDAGVLHRNVVPENVIVGQEDVVVGGVRVGRKMVYRICGFGVSEPAAQAEKDGSGPLASPAPYRAPELFLFSNDYDGRVDTWGLGCIMAELLAGTGEPFFGGKLDIEVFERMLRVVGAKGIINWSGLERVAATDRADYLRKHCRKERGCLREVFPREVLSPAGFKVLKGLLQSNPERRLTAAAALRKPWFRRPGFGGCFVPCGGGASP
jgi:cell division cycle 2-like